MRCGAVVVSEAAARVRRGVAGLWCVYVSRVGRDDDGRVSAATFARDMPIVHPTASARRLGGRPLACGQPSQRAALELMFERFTEHARQVIVSAQEEARALKHDYLGSEHILLGLVRQQDAVATRILLGFDADVAKIRAAVLALLSTHGGLHEAGQTAHASGAAASARSLAGASIAELDSVIEELLADARRISRRLDVVHGQIDVLRAERDKRQRGQSQPDA